jgi:hypothetical protein
MASCFPTPDPVGAHPIQPGPASKGENGDLFGLCQTKRRKTPGEAQPGLEPLTR